MGKLLQTLFGNDFLDKILPFVLQQQKFRFVCQPQGLRR